MCIIHRMKIDRKRRKSSFTTSLVIFAILVILGIFGKIPEARLLDDHTISDFLPSAGVSSYVTRFCPKIQFWQNPNIFMSFSPLFSTFFFSWNQSCQHPKNRQFSQEISWIFGQKMKISNSVSTKLKSINEFFTQLKLSFSKICTLK